jgi:hypothetical protein
MREIKRTKPTACRWETTLTIFNENKNYEVSFLFDEEGVEDHTIAYWIDDVQITDERVVPDEVTNYVMGLEYNDLMKGLGIK